MVGIDFTVAFTKISLVIAFIVALINHSLFSFPDTIVGQERQHMNVGENEPARLHCTDTTITNSDVVWFKNDQALTVDDNKQVLQNGSLK